MISGPTRYKCVLGALASSSKWELALEILREMKRAGVRAGGCSAHCGDSKPALNPSNTSGRFCSYCMRSEKLCT